MKRKHRQAAGNTPACLVVLFIWRKEVLEMECKLIWTDADL